MENNKKIIGIILALIMISVIGLVIVNRDMLFKSEVTIEYKDGCIEEYYGGELITEKCETSESVNNNLLWLE